MLRQQLEDVYFFFLSGQRERDNCKGSFLYFWKEWESPEEDCVLEVQRGFSFALSDNEQVKRNGIFPFGAFKLRETPVFVSSRFFVFSKRLYICRQHSSHWTFRGGLESKSVPRLFQMLEVRKSTKKVLPY